MKCTLYGLLDRGNLLDIIANFIVFDVEDGKRVKKIARYHQFRATNKIVDRALGVDQPSAERRGIVWHTQGSGKSLTMIFAARKLWNHPALHAPTLVIVVDREQLEEQMAGELFGTNTESVAVAGTKRELRDLLAHNYRGVILTLVHKFDDIEPEMTSRANVIALVDEATALSTATWASSCARRCRTHRCSGSPAPQSSSVTVTHRERLGRRSPRTSFERNMDRYSIRDSIRDGATKPIHYEVRLTRTGPSRTLTWIQSSRNCSPTGARKSGAFSWARPSWTRSSSTLAASPRWPTTSPSHFVEHVRPNRFKGMLACRDKEACCSTRPLWTRPSKSGSAARISKA